MDFDLLVHEAWPAYEQRTYDGWILRYAGGVTKRANSVLALGRPADLAGAIEAAEAFYAEKGQRSVFSVGVGAMPGLDDELAARGYGVVDPTVIMVGDGVPEPVRQVRVEERPWPGWLETWWAVDGRYAEGVEAAERICRGVPALYAAVEEDGRGRRRRPGCAAGGDDRDLLHGHVAPGSPPWAGQERVACSRTA